MTKRSSPSGSSRRRRRKRRASEKRVQSRSIPSEAKPKSLSPCGPALSPAATPRVSHRPPDCTGGSPHTSTHPSTLWCWLSSRLWRCEVAWLETTPKTITVAGNFVFITLGTLNRPDLHFEGAGNGPVVITWIGREHELYSSASPIAFVEHCVTFRHNRRLLLLLGLIHNWPTSIWSATQKKRKPVFIKQKWNHVVFSRATMLSFHPVFNLRRDGPWMVSVLFNSSFQVFQWEHVLLSTPSDCLVLYLEHSLVRGLTPVQRSSRYIV